MAGHENPNLEINDLLLSQPKDIIYNIFLRLPVKDLSRIRSVSKSWLSLITSREFIKTHLSISTNDPHFTHHRLILADCDHAWFDLSTCSMTSLLTEPFIESCEIKGVFIDRIVGHCNGLVIIKEWCRSSQLFLWNPSTREVRTLPKHNRVCSSPDTIYGFCYEGWKDDFKVFAISPALRDYKFFDLSRTRYEYKVSVYSLKCNCWRILIGDFPFRIACRAVFDDGKFANESIYWIVTPEMGKKIIVSVDIETETFREVLHPNFGDGVYNWTLGTFSKSLLVLCQYENACADFWMMKECGVKESWTKLFTISYMGYRVLCDSYLKPICISVNGYIVFNSDSIVALYNSNEKKLKNLLSLEFEKLDVCAYVESLVSPHQ